MIANPNPNLPKRLQWYIVLAALTCVSASSSTVEPNTIFAGSAALKQPLGVVGQSDARVKRYLRRNSDATESMDDENEDRGGNLGSAVEQGIAKITGSVEGGVTSGVSAAIDQGLAAKVGEAGKSDVIPGNSGKNVHPVAKDGELVKETVGSSIQDVINQEFKSIMGKNLELYKNEENDVRANMFKSEEFTKWNNEVNARFSEKPAAAASYKVETLLSEFEKDDLIKMLAAAERDPTTKAIADHLEMGLLGKWMKAGGEEDKIMDLITVGKDKSEVLMGNMRKYWFSVLTVRKKNPYELFVTHFTKRYGDKNLVELLVVAKANKDTEKMATKLAEHQLKIWQESGIDVKSCFDLLELNKEHPDTLLRNPMLSTWINYVELLGSDPYKVLLLTMRKQVGDKKLYSILAAGDNKLDSILAAAKADDTNARIRRTLLHIQEKRLQEYPQMKTWMKNGKSVGNVFDLLKLQDKGEEMLGTKDWDAWVAYVTFLEEQKQPTDQREIATVIYAVLKNRFSSKGLAKLVATAKTVESTKEIARKWKRSEWHIAQRTPDDVFNLLKLKEKGNAVFESPDFENWALYVIELNRARNRKDDVELAHQLYGHYGPDVERMLKQSEKTASANNDEDTKLIVGMLLDVIKR
ncbi:hypothetical protein KXD40_009428 [Peronospora effusa]|uniref:RxLR effector protein n=1 Tax=Peronospora effusa TaxID=542832 RepID=A0A3R7W3U8_9STRA|nr:hypothetical protein DD237_007313 [Peronospora effusa]UIZ28715.1 hypothetical protein KXD40_009428 [Peronospora effusa]